jgi:Zn-finger protein
MSDKEEAKRLIEEAANNPNSEVYKKRKELCNTFYDSLFVCTKCGKNKRYERDGKRYKLCASCAWASLLAFMESMDGGDEK